MSKRKNAISITVPIEFTVDAVMGDGGWSHGGLHMTMGGAEVTDDGKELGTIRAAVVGYPVVTVKKGKLSVVLSGSLQDIFTKVKEAVDNLELPAENPEPVKK